MEIADVFVVNKADREGADRAAAAVEAVLALGDADDRAWRPPIVKAVATSGEGVREVLDAIERFRREAAPRSGERRRLRSDFRLREALGAQFMARAERAVAPPEWQALVTAIDERRLDPHGAATLVVARAIGPGPVPTEEER
jgi:LAO/AO transport system kinase